MRHEINAQIADRLRAMAELREVQGDDGFRVEAYRRAAREVDLLGRPVDAILAAEGRAGLIALPHIGEGIASAISEMVTTGRWAQLDRLTGELEPERLFQTIPGVGPKLALRLHDELDAETLEQLELAAHDGRLEQIPGVGPRRAAAIRVALNDRLGRRRVRASTPIAAPPVDELLTVDAAYRRKAAAGELNKIAPKRLNPSGKAWLPIMHVDRGAWRYTALFSNTLKAHQLGLTRDWVVIYFHTDLSPESQATVVTETRGALKGRRVVRGREDECAEHHGIKGKP